MGSLAKSLIALSLAMLVAAALASCGAEDAKLLPGETAREITANLDTVGQLADEGDCVGAESATEQVGEQIEALGDVDAELKRSLQEGADRLDEVVASCEEAETEAVAPAEIPSSEEGDKEEEREEEKREKEEEKQQKQEEKEEGSDDAQDDEGSSALPPQAKGEGKGLDEGHGGGPPASEGEVSPPSGGVGPGSAVGEEDD